MRENEDKSGISFGPAEIRWTSFLKQNWAFNFILEMNLLLNFVVGIPQRRKKTQKWNRIYNGATLDQG